MELAYDAANVINAAIRYAKNNRREFVTPEVLLLSMLDNDDNFSEALQVCGGDSKALTRELTGYISEYIDGLDAILK